MRAPCTPRAAVIVNPYPVTVALREQGDRRPDSRGRRAPMPVTYVVSQPDLDAPVGSGTARRQAIRRHLRVGRSRRPHEAETPRPTPPAHKPLHLAQRFTRPRGRPEDLRDGRAALRRPEGLSGPYGDGEIREPFSRRRPSRPTSRSLWPSVRHRPLWRRLDRERRTDLRSRHGPASRFSRRCRTRRCNLASLLPRGGRTPAAGRPLVEQAVEVER